MIIENRWFALQFPRRADLSGRPFGLLFLWFGVAGRQESLSRFGQWPDAKAFGFCFCWLARYRERRRSREYEWLDCMLLKDVPGRVPHDWRQWPQPYRDVSQAAVMKAVSERPGAKIVEDKSFCDRRIDLSSRPLQMYRVIRLKKAA